MQTATISTNSIGTLVQTQRDYFASNATKSVDFRKQQLKKLHKLIEDNEDAIVKALHQDLRKHEFEAYTTEVGIVMVELQKAIKKVGSWAKPKRVGTPLFLFKGSSYLQPEPYGTVLVIAPWNYPFQLLLAPVVGAIAAGNTVVMKPSELAPHTSALVARLINDNFDSRYLSVVEGGIPETQALLEQRYDYIFFTGGTAVGKIIYKAAAEYLTPVTLELGGKSPCIIDNEVQLDYTAKRIMWGKFTNAGQTCIAPDYILIDAKLKNAFVEKCKGYLKRFYGDNPQQSNSYARIINEKHWSRLVSYLDDGNILVGGQADVSDLFIAPTLMDKVPLDAAIMTDEIFGPILPIHTYTHIQEAIDLIKSRPKPLALYIFSKDQSKIDKILNETSAGGVTINDTLMHIANPNLPFGGVGDSGIGAYHGESSFHLFSHQKPVLHRSFLIDDPVRYAPYKMSRKMVKRIMDWTL